MARILTFFSGKGGTGKSFTATNISCGLKILGYRTLLIDFSFGIRNDDAILGLTDSVLCNIGDLLSAQCKISDAVVCSDKEYVPDFIAASPYNLPEGFEKSCRTMIKDISKEYDFIIFDCPFASGSEFNVSCTLADTAIAVTTEDYFSVSNTALCMARLDDYSFKSKYLIINKAQISAAEDDISAEEIIDEISCRLLGIIPYDKNVMSSLEKGDPIIRYDTPAGTELEYICKRLCGESIPYTQYKKTRMFFDKKDLKLKK